MRINKYLAASGLGSRRKVEKLILEGKIHVNKKPLKDLSYIIQDGDMVTFEGRDLKILEKKTYIYNKPTGFICSHFDPYNNKSIYEHLPKNEGLFSVGRLDMNSEGLLLITNDGDYAHGIAHPSSETEKEYIVVLDRELTDTDRLKILKGIFYRGVFYKADDIYKHKIKKSDRNIIDNWPPEDSAYIYNIVLHEGKKREIRYIFKSLSYGLSRLIRIRIGDILLKDLSPAKYRSLS